MKFIDEARIEVHAGKGGNGAMSFRREKFIPRGGPDGGDGGRGGSIYAVADRNINTLIDFRFAHTHKGKNGEPGRGADQYGRGADDIILRMPVGTVISDAETGEIVADLAVDGETIVLAKGGQGGLGIQFLKHLQRTRLLLHLVDMAPFDEAIDPVKEVRAIAGELKKYDPELFAKPRWLVLNKLDLIADPAERAKRVADVVKRLRWKGPVFSISAMKGDGCRDLCRVIGEYLGTVRKAEADAEAEASAKAKPKAKTDAPDAQADQ